MPSSENVGLPALRVDLDIGHVAVSELVQRHCRNAHLAVFQNCRPGAVDVHLHSSRFVARGSMDDFDIGNAVLGDIAMEAFDIVGHRLDCNDFQIRTLHGKGACHHSDVSPDIDNR